MYILHHPFLSTICFQWSFNLYFVYCVLLLNASVCFLTHK